MKSLLILTLIAITFAAPRIMLAGETNKTDEASQPVDKAEKSAKPKQKTPPGLQKTGGLPPGQAKKQQVPMDVSITNAPMTNVVVRPAAGRPKVEDKRVESPRGADALPVLRPEDTNKVARARAEAAKGKAPAPTAKQEKELESELLRINATWANLNRRPAALHKIALETGMTEAQLSEQVGANSKLDAGGLLMANKIAALTSRPPGDVYAAHKGRIRWLTTGAELGADPAAVLESAKRVSTALR